MSAGPRAFCCVCVCVCLGMMGRIIGGLTLVCSSPNPPTHSADTMEYLIDAEYTDDDLAGLGIKRGREVRTSYVAYAPVCLYCVGRGMTWRAPKTRPHDHTHTHDTKTNKQNKQTVPRDPAGHRPLSRLLRGGTHRPPHPAGRRPRAEPRPPGAVWARLAVFFVCTCGNCDVRRATDAAGF